MRPIEEAWRSRARSGAVVAVLLLAVTALAGCGGSDKSKDGTSDDGAATSASQEPNPVADGHGGVRETTLYYLGKEKLTTGADLSFLGSPSVVVTTPKADQPAAIKAIHSVGAKAYRYVQYYWAPDDASYEGVNLADHPDWAFCRSGSTPLLGRVTNQGGHQQKWYFIDSNEDGARAEILKALEKLKDEGWDGVMFDRGGAALTNAPDAQGKPVWDTASSCTGHAHQSGARFADAYVNVLGLAHQAGLRVMVNYGISPFDPVMPMRPEPSDAACQQHQWTRCAFTDDVWKYADLVLNESVSFPKDEQWSRSFTANKRSEQDAKHGRRVVGLITTFTLGGAQNQTRPKVFYEWSRAKLFDISMAVNTGDGGCPNARTDVCNRYGTYPDLVNVEFGPPTGKDPVSTSCTGTSKIHCVWTRSYAGGVNVLNASAQDRPGVDVKVGSDGCRYVYDVYSRAALSGNRCVDSVALDLPPWSGRPLILSDKPFT
jgi:hypothetical protein